MRRTQHHPCDIPAKDAWPESNCETISRQNWGSFYKIMFWNLGCLCTLVLNRIMEFLLWQSGLRIRHGCSGGVGCSCGEGSTPGPGTYICHGVWLKKKSKRCAHLFFAVGLWWSKCDFFWISLESIYFRLKISWGNFGHTMKDSTPYFFWPKFDQKALKGHLQ